MTYGDYFSAQLVELRKQYEVLLLTWLQDPDNMEALKEIEDIFTRLTAIERREPFRQLWWLASGLVEGMLVGGISCSEYSKKLLASLDNELEHVQHTTIRNFQRRPPFALVQVLLDELSTSSMKGPNLGNIFREFELGSRKAI